MKILSFDLSDDALEKFLIEINNAAHKGVLSTGNVTMSEPNWSFGQSIFFSVTVLTTIGNLKLLYMYMLFVCLFDGV